MAKADYTVSMMSVNLLNVEADIKAIDPKTTMYHIDIMDGHYVPNLTFSFEFIKAIKKVVTKPIDAHLMVERPLDFIDLAIEAGSDYITLHPDTIYKSAFRTINYIKNKGIKVGVALLPTEDINVIESYIHLIDKVTIMGVDPGFGGAKEIQEVLPKMKRLSEYKRENNLDFIIEIDGGAKEHTFETYLKHGVEQLVLGSGLFARKEATLEERFEAIIKQIEGIEV